jgi:type I restriction enzyme S subunit
MHADWPETTLEELRSEGCIEFSDGYRTRADELEPAGIPILRVADVADGQVIPSFKDRVAESYRSRIGAKLSRVGDVLITTKGTVGRVARVRPGLPEHVYSPQLCFIRSLASDKIHPEWLYFVTRSPQVAAQMGTVKDQTDMAPYISLTDLRRLRLRVPGMDEQRRIAGVLGALDDLIETNRKLASDLRRLRWATVEQRVSWDGVNVVELAKMVSLRRERVMPGEVEMGTPYLGLEHFATGGGGIVSVGEVDAVDSQKSRFLAGDILYGKLRPYFRKVDRPDFSGVCSTEIWVVRANEPDLTDFVEWMVASPAFTALSSTASEGTRMPRANWKHASRLSVSLPSAGQRHMLHEQLTPLYEMEWGLRKEGTDLADVRDELLPLLMSGRVSVDEAWEAVG